VEWSAETYGLKLDQMPRAMPELRAVSQVVYSEQRALENLGIIRKKLPRIFPTKRLLLEGGGLSKEAGHR